MNSKVLASLCCLIFFAGQNVAAAEIQLSGFGSFVGGIRNDENVDSYDDYYIDDLDFKPDSLVGLQVSAEINEQASVTVQWLAQGINDWSADVNWAYARYQFDNSLMAKLGRVGIPFYLYSDYLAIGYSYPWISLPYHVYHLPYSSIDGVDLVYSMSLANIDLQLQGYGGNSSFTPVSGIFLDMPTETRSQYGLVVELNWNSWKFRYGYHGADLYVDTSATESGRLSDGLATALRNEGYLREADGFVIDNDYTDFQGIGLQYDDGRFLVVAEGVEVSTHDKTPAPLVRAWYLLGGMRVDTLLYHLTYSVKDHERPSLAGNLPVTSPSYALVKYVEDVVVEDESGWTLGVRWDFAESLAFKAEFADITDRKYHKRFRDDEADIWLLRFGIQTVF